MFTIVGVLFFLAGCIPLYRALQNTSGRSEAEVRSSLRRPGLLVAADAAMIVLFVLFVLFGSVFTDLLWFRNLGYDQRYWTLLSTKVVLFVIGVLVGFACIFTFLKIASSKTAGKNSAYMLIVSVVTALIMGTGLSVMWHKTLLFFGRVGSAILDPVFGCRSETGSAP